MFTSMLALLEQLIEHLEDAPAAERDTEALMRQELANLLAKAAAILRALAADEKL